ncbi:hypothetical protein BC832DRAFT_559405 [Gaertneriomyces semiglobifer]|nr:hypothetical protein BC832DRAFT_559405 [Gaertneriomyces semiglobifer]
MFSKFRSAGIIAIALASTSALAQTNATDIGAANTALASICGTHPVLPACEVLHAVSCGTSSQHQSCNPIRLVLSACDDPVATADPTCAPWEAYTGAAVPLANLPTAKNASDLLRSICTEMPSMQGCQGDKACPAPDAATGISQCPVFTRYSDLCRDMPEMTQCKDWAAFCTNNDKLGAFCRSGKTYVSNGTATDTGSGHEGHDNGADHATQFSNTFLALMGTAATALLL